MYAKNAAKEMSAKALLEFERCRDILKEMPGVDEELRLKVVEKLRSSSTRFNMFLIINMEEKQMCVEMVKLLYFNTALRHTHPKYSNPFDMLLYLS